MYPPEISTSTAMFSASAEEQYGKIHTVYAQNINQEVLRKLADGIDKYEFSIDIEEYNVSRKELNNITNALVLCYPELFYFTDIGVSFVGNRVLSIEVYYDYDIEEIIARRQLFNEAADSILAKVDSSMSDFEKALLLHDELAVHGTYALNRPNADDILIDRFGQCSAYTLAYSYLLSRVGVDSEIVVSNEMHHTWNKVCIDGTYYNVDVTWDDQDLIRYIVRHKYCSREYPVIFCDEAQDFYRKTVNAIPIPGSEPTHSVYRELFRFQKEDT